MAKQDLTGKKFNRLLVIERVVGKLDNRYWLCKCDCGNKKIVYESHLTRGLIKSCKCFHRESVSTHSMSRTNEYKIWHQMKCRCNDSNSVAYKFYGGRGIKVCDKWNTSEGFNEFIKDMGKRPSKNYSIDRINTNGNYEPSNCRWATREIQSNNTRGNRVLVFNGLSLTESQWANKLNIKVSTIRNRLWSGWDVERTLSEPVRIICRHS